MASECSTSIQHDLHNRLIKDPKKYFKSKYKWIVNFASKQRRNDVQCFDGLTRLLDPKARKLARISLKMREAEMIIAPKIIL